MRILFDSQNEWFKSPFGCLRQNQPCRLRIEIPKHCNATLVWCCIQEEQGFSKKVPLTLEGEQDGYQRYAGTFSLEVCGFYHYYFEVETQERPFRLMKWGQHDTNMEAGEQWQLTCFSCTFETPDQWKGCVMYQIFPDRFHQVGSCNCTEKLKPFEIQHNKAEVPVYLPDGKGRIWNNYFFGGNLKGIEEKLPYLSKLGVSALYLNPIFMAFSNHRYDTADYKRIDPMLGTTADFMDLCKAAHKRGIQVILDGVFSHTGSDSVYFDRWDHFGNGAYHHPDSPYRDWFSMDEKTGHYVCWWGIDTLPCVNEMNPSYLDYMIDGEDSVIAYWLGLGADGFRLDVADELPDLFIERLHQRVKSIKPEGIVIGEVWEDASNKISYGVRRQYFVREELDSVMNYPCKDAILGFLNKMTDAQHLANTIMTIAENYPHPVLHCLMNILSTHDTMRALSLLGDTPQGLDRNGRAHYSLPPQQLAAAKEKLKIAAMLQYVLPGCPCIYYGDEVGMEGFEDPFNRRYFPWDNIDTELLAYYQKLGKLKNESVALRKGTVIAKALDSDVFIMRREWEEEQVTLLVNCSEHSYEHGYDGEELLLSQHSTLSHNQVIVQPNGFALLKGHGQK